MRDIPVGVLSLWESADAEVMLVSSICLLVFPTGITASKVLISLLHCQALKDKVWKNIVK